ncbi:malic enzyme-like NAD(P)-binding protein [Methylotenera sp.]|uniref:malic enzyme-like NAD(P)-binding protein n=1 Tax=Methylotenera sp. TaxID=2051956 RepID=UPI002717251E|nr:malic enzyme-like NAD(P)-binding protein [Methylotenera sp.]MDO9205669.1 malic enzyme-like NAD(P)-binding protein [Methylotenera sp.]MDP2230441.1 malic enzyme-like NAD(P)-binding protein [Methylotenera sp.]MDP3141152.1 malic enzyme-like NAD(P)-binding protein [Methylotenera sp.]MDP3306912.1 malic enzyme-like NAD(P)-binding protein [Methylotenera sp.]MDP3819329.1 malic enzyme-like NAD(P)-binding protein [Methylotenera sp.]
MDDLKKRALDYHEFPKPGKLSVESSKPCATQDDLSLAYTPGVAVPVREINRDPANAYKYTNKGNLVAVITDGTAVLGLGNMGPLASKPVMEGKAVLFKHFAGIDVFDIEVNAPTIEAFIETVVNIAPTFGGINLEDIAAPHCFRIEKELRARLDIPVFHDDQHGTAVIVAAALSNALELQGKTLPTAKIVFLGAGAAGCSCARLLKLMGATNITMVDKSGVLDTSRADLHDNNRHLAVVPSTAKTLADVMPQADVFIGVSAANTLSPELLKLMAANPVVFALANPDPEILPSLAHAVRDDILMATGRSDFPNQVNNALCFPYLFRGALDAKAKQITDEMQIAAACALAALAREPVPADVLQAYNLTSLSFGKDYIIPKPFDKRLLARVSGAVADAARLQQAK